MSNRSDGLTWGTHVKMPMDWSSSSGWLDAGTKNVRWPNAYASRNLILRAKGGQKLLPRYCVSAAQPTYDARGLFFSRNGHSAAVQLLPVFRAYSLHGHACPSSHGGFVLYVPLRGLFCVVLTSALYHCDFRLEPWSSSNWTRPVFRA